ncbi:AMP-binding protein [Rhodococcus sp. NPDC003318]|uniref:AMP-binding protein n=1 Tax=Rhodococcus sp. NPDC003318 TaxID=3364503 RepID=UPI003688C44B
MTSPVPEPQTVWSILSESARTHTDREAVVDTSERLTYRQLAAAAHRAGRAMIAAGIEHGDRIALWAPNSVRWTVVVLGAHSIGAVVVPINTRARGHEAAEILRRTRVRQLFLDNGFLDTDYTGLLRAAAGPPAADAPFRDLPDLRGVVDLHRDPDAGWDGFVASGDDPRALDLRRLDRHRAAAAGDVAYVMSTSGSTGTPKGVVLRHGQLVRVYRDLGERLGIDGSDRLLGVNPLSHSFGLNAGLLAALAVGGCYVAVDVFDAAAVRGLVEAERITVVSGPPTLFTDLIGDGTAPPFDPAPRLAVTGAATVTAELLDRIRMFLGIGSVATGYGLTEAAGTVTAQRPHPGGPDGLAAPALPGIEMRTVDGSGRDVGPGRAGEVLVRGFNVMSGYLDDADATARVLDADGWLHTGDIGVLDDDGALRVVDRIGEMFVVGGFNVYPAEIESVLAAHPAVGEVAVLGVPDERLGRRPVAYVVPIAPVDGCTLRDHCRELLSGYKVPTAVILLDEMPRTPSGKASRPALRALGGR